jgi:hypothetical protein
MFPAPTARHEWADEVTGHFPNVPAYIAGQPLNMRRRVKREHEASPIAIAVDLSSSGVISAQHMEARGSAILALVRAPSSRRPVELYFGSGNDARGGDCLHQFYKMDTTPLDLARAAFCLSSVAVSRGALFSIVKNGYGGRLQQPYLSHMGITIAGRNYRDTIKRALPHIEDVIAVPQIYAADRSITDPVGWVKEYVKAHGDVELEE